MRAQLPRTRKPFRSHALVIALPVVAEIHARGVPFNASHTCRNHARTRARVTPLVAHRLGHAPRLGKPLAVRSCARRAFAAPLGNRVAMAPSGRGPWSIRSFSMSPARAARIITAAPRAVIRWRRQAPELSAKNRTYSPVKCVVELRVCLHERQRVVRPSAPPRRRRAVAARCMPSSRAARAAALSNKSGVVGRHASTGHQVAHGVVQQHERVGFVVVVVAGERVRRTAGAPPRSCRACWPCLCRCRAF
jgi:hypothetical protein